MKLISFRNPCFFQVNVLGRSPIYKGVNPGERIVTSDDAGLKIFKENKEFVYDISDFMPLYYSIVRRPSIFKKKRILFYRGRGIGDQLAASSLSKFFSEKLDAICFQLCDEIHEPLWYANPYIQNIPVRFPLSIDAFIRGRHQGFYDYFFALESVTEWISEPEQGNFYDHLFSLCGFDPTNIPKEYKMPVWGMGEVDIRSWRLYKMAKGLKVEGNPVDGNDKDLGLKDERYIFLQLHTTNSIRNPPIEVYKFFINSLSKIKEGIKILCVADTKKNEQGETISYISDEMKDLIKDNPNCILCEDVEGVRLYGTLVCRSILVVGPDSSAVHFAATHHVPCIGIWGPFSPESRAKYYLNQYHLYRSDMCEHSPCFHYDVGFPIMKCPKGPATNTCACFEGISQENVDKIIDQCVSDQQIKKILE